MYLKKIIVSNFKNLGALRLDFSPKINCITGINGSGKTSLLDAVYYLSVTKSYFSGHDHAVINHDQQSASIIGDYINEDSTHENISLMVSRNGDKQLRRNSKLYTRMSDHLGLIPVVMVSPSDSSLINESGEERRRFLNSILSQVDSEYLRKMQRYNQLLAARNKILKEGSPSFDLLDMLSAQMSDAATYVHSKRGEFCRELQPVASDYYAKLSGGRENIMLTYKSEIDSAPLYEILKGSIEKDHVMKYTTSGIQRDDVLFDMNGYSIRKFGSQGQQKSFLLALKLAQFEIMNKIYGRPPILLLDDVFDKLDMQRVQFLLELVAQERFGQIFITDSNKVRVSALLEEVDGESLSFELEGGRAV